MRKVMFRTVFCGKLLYPVLLTCFIFVAFQFYLFLVIGNMRNDFTFNDNDTSKEPKDAGVHLRQISFSKGKHLAEAKAAKESCLDHSKETLSAFKRAKTNECKELILQTSCQQQYGQLYPKSLKRTCPSLSASMFGKQMGCFRDSSKRRLLPDHVTDFKESNSPAQCISHCLRLGFPLSGVEYGVECHCGLALHHNFSTLSLPSHLCDKRCPAPSNQTCGGYYAIEIYQTGLSKVFNNASYVSAFHSSDKKVRILFVLTLTGRALRQVLRLLKTIYRPYHYYLIHVDKRQEYLHRELTAKVISFPNIRMTAQRFSTIWGGASLLEMLLSCMVEGSSISGWSWDYFINLSESDYPIKTIEELDSFLSVYSGKNFLKSHGKNTARFIQRQGLDMYFLECENRMWRLGQRPLQWGINIDGGSDWVGLHRSFVTYLITGTDPLLDGLKSYWKYSLLPAESFFHTVLQNSRFCRTLINNNLHLTNWRRKQGCHCQYKHVVDWCGCSPNDYRVSDLSRLQNTRSSPEYFARKFEAIVNQDIINLIDDHLLHRNTPGLPSVDSFWLNIWSGHDLQPNDLYLTFLSSLARSLHSRCNFATPLRILDAFVYKKFEKVDGVVIKVKVVESSGGIGGVKSTHGNQGEEEERSGDLSGVLEAIFFRSDQKFLYKRNSDRIKYVEVGTDFDPKEEIFRNYLYLFGPHSDLVVVFHVSLDSEAEDTIIIDIVDPSAVVAYTSSVVIAKGISIVTHTPKLEKPLEPGVWMVRTKRQISNGDLVQDHDWMVQTRFLILPLSHYNGRLIKEKEAALVNMGLINHLAENDNHDNNKNRTRIEQQSDREFSRNKNSRTGHDLDAWIDQLLFSFWKQSASCLVSTLPTSSSNGQQSLCHFLPPCEETSWSTFYPDPKSNFVPLDTGDSFR